MRCHYSGVVCHVAVVAAAAAVVVGVDGVVAVAVYPHGA